MNPLHLIIALYVLAAIVLTLNLAKVISGNSRNKKGGKG